MRLSLERLVDRGLYWRPMSNLLEPSSRPEANGAVAFCAVPLCRMVLLMAATLLLGAAFWMDQEAVEFVRQNANGWGKWFAGRVSFWGDFPGVLAIGLVAWAIGRWRKNVRWQHAVLLMGLCAVLSGLSANVVRAGTGRARPFTPGAPGWYGVSAGARIGKSAPDFQSFPSAHTAVVAGFFSPLVLLSIRSRRRWIPWTGCLLGFAGTSLMAWARVWNGKHHLSDVLASMLLGLAIGVLILRRLERRNLNKTMVS